MSSFLQLEQLAKSFGSIRALDGVDLTVGEEELLVVLGPTSAGKTTLLRTIAGLEKADRGIVRMDGNDVSRRSPAERDVALVFQNFSLYAGWTVRRNLEFPLRAPRRELGAEEIDQRVGWAASILRISHLMERRTEQLSDGMPVMEVSRDPEPEMLLGIRPENLQPDGGSEPARVQLVEESGPNLVLAVEWSGSIVHILTDRSTPTAPGDQIYPHIDPERAMLWSRGEQKIVERI